jgi:hypothetical protein
MSSVDSAIDAQVRNIEAQYGKTVAEWMAIIQQSGKTKHGEIMALLKTEYGMTHGNANRIALIARDADTATNVRAQEAAGIDPLAAMYEGKKAALKPAHDALIAFITPLGSDIELAPKKGYVSLRRKKQFAMIQPTTATRIDVGLVLKGEPTTDRLESAASFNEMFTHRVRVASAAEVDDQLKAWIKQAYDGAG